MHRVSVLMSSGAPIVSVLSRKFVNTSPPSFGWARGCTKKSESEKTQRKTCIPAFAGMTKTGNAVPRNLWDSILARISHGISPRSKPLRSRPVGTTLRRTGDVSEWSKHRGETQLNAKHYAGRRNFVLLCPLSTRLTPRELHSSRLFLIA
jgi:hypothetical protein